MTDILEEARELWTLCFPTDSPAFIDFYFSRVAKAEDTYIDYNDAGLPIAHIGILRYNYIDITEGQTFSFAYISGACTHPDARQSGVMTKLMMRVIQTETTLGTDALILIPASAELRSYYQRHFHFIDTAPRYSIPAEKLSELRLPELDHKTDSPQHLMIDYANQHPCLTLDTQQVNLIFEEYQLETDSLVECVEDTEQVSGLLLGYREQDKATITRIIGSRFTCSLLLNRLYSLGIKHISLTNLFPSNFSTYPGLPNHLPSEPWGMARPLNDNISIERLRQIEITFVHE